MASEERGMGRLGFDWVWWTFVSGGCGDAWMVSGAELFVE